MQSASPSSYFVLAIVDTNTDALVAVGTIFLEHKFIRNLGICGHIEDIAVDPSTQGRGLGKILINALTELSESLGSYKVILDCSEDVRRESHTKLTMAAEGEADLSRRSSLVRIL
jgi:glucosamine-phosphate N-acetyltransferase